MKTFFALFLFPLSLLIAEDSSSHMMVDNLSVLQNTFFSHYAPVQWKEASLGWKMDEEFLEAKKTVLEKPHTIKEFQNLLAKLFGAFQDYHTRIYFHSTARATLPFIVTEINEKYFVTWSNVDSIQKGDEIVLWNGKPPAVEAKTLVYGHQSETQKKLAASFLTLRQGALGFDMPQETLTLEVKQENSQETLQTVINWTIEEEQIPAPPITDLPKKAFKRVYKALKRGKTRLKAAKNPFFHRDFTWAPYRQTQATKPHFDDMRPQLVGNRTSFVPSLGEGLISSAEEDPIHAYLFQLPSQKKAGYLRIPSYMLDGEDFQAIKEWLRLFEAAADVLVIDQVNNPGGSLWSVYALLTHLSSDPIKVFKNRISLTQEEVAFSVWMLDQLNFEEINSDEEAQDMLGESMLGIPIDLNFAKSLQKFLKDSIEEWSLGNRLTKPLPLFGIEKIQPHSNVRFTKPILVLINELDFSCGDLFPAIMQDNKRAVLFGSKTAGAGGYVLQTSFPNLAGIDAFTYTGSLLERLDGSYIENVGVSPDISYVLTEDDVKTGAYQEYKSAVIEALEGLIKE